MAGQAVPRLTTIEEVRKLTGGAQTSEDTHGVAELLAIYTLETPIRCSLPDKTPHKEGCVIRSHCNRVLNIGHKCGKHWMPELAGLIKADAERSNLERNIVKMRGARAKVEQAEGYAKRIMKLSMFIDRVEAKISSLHDTLRRVARGTETNEVEVRRKGIDDKLVIERYAVVGAEIFDERRHVDPDRLLSQSIYVTSLCERAGDETTVEAARKAVRELDRLSELVRLAGAFVGYAHRFLSDVNMERALQLACVTDVVVSKTGFVLPDGTVIRVAGVGDTDPS